MEFPCICTGTEYTVVVCGKFSDWELKINISMWTVWKLWKLKLNIKKEKPNGLGMLNSFTTYSLRSGCKFFSSVSPENFCTGCMQAEHITSLTIGNIHSKTATNMHIWCVKLYKNSFHSCLIVLLPSTSIKCNNAKWLTDNLFHALFGCLWSPYGIGQTIIFSSCGFFMVVLCNRADHYIFILFLSSFFLLFFPRLISVVGDWMFTILRHMVWP